MTALMELAMFMSDALLLAMAALSPFLVHWLDRLISLLMRIWTQPCGLARMEPRSLLLWMR